MRIGKKFLFRVTLFIFLNLHLILSVYGNQGPYGDDHTNSSNAEDFWGEDNIKQFESVHDHSSPQGGQVGMAGSLHVEFVAREDGEYKIYITGYERNPIDVSKATGFLIINPESSESEKLILSVDKVLQGFLWATGKPHKQGETITASMEVEIPGQEKIIQSFYIEINHSSTEQKIGHEEKKDGHHAH
jgi:hypothetical protein